MHWGFLLECCPETVCGEAPSCLLEAGRPWRKRSSRPSFVWPPADLPDECSHTNEPRKDLEKSHTNPHTPETQKWLLFPAPKFQSSLLHSIKYQIRYLNSTLKSLSLGACHQPRVDSSEHFSSLSPLSPCFSCFSKAR